MLQSDYWALGASLLFLIFGCGWVIFRPRFRQNTPDSRPARAPNALDMQCTVCQRPLVFERRDLRQMHGAEVALVVSTRPDVTGKRLAELVCPHCEAAHCFILERRRALWLGVNFMQPQEKAAYCFECRKPLKSPPWPPGTYDGRLDKAPALPGDIGLTCKHCKAVCCVQCCENTTRGRTSDGSLLCPRCFRHPMETVFHP